MDSTALLTVRELRVRAVHVPMPLPLRTSSGTIQIAPLALIDLLTEQGITGHSYLFCYTPLALKPVVQLLENLSPPIQGDPVAPLALERKLQGMFRLLGLKGVTGMALAGIDMAAWDAQARAQGLPLARLLGADRDRVPAYNSCGLGMIGSHDAPAEAEHLLVHGFEAIKVRLGYVEARTDVEVVWAVRRAIGEEVALMADYNQILSVAEAVRRTDMLQDEDLHWVEEPTLADDFSGHAQIRSRTRIPVQMGENWWGTHDMAKSLAAGASDLGMPDAMKIGGVSGWLRAAALAEAAGMPVSSHLFPEVSAHLLAATPTAHWLEYVDWANPVLRSPLRIELGQAVVSDRPGTGIEWDEDAVAQYLVN